MEALPSFGVHSVAAHSTRDGLHIIIAGKVYDVTKYLTDHPGGVDVLLEVAGKDATEAYNDVGHSEDADEILASCLIGTAEPSEHEPRRSKNVKLVMQDRVMHTSPRQTSPTSLWIIKASAGSFLVASAAHAVWSFGSQIRPNSSISSLLTSPEFFGGIEIFFGGFLISSLISTLGATFVAKQLTKFTQLESGFTKYPPRRKQHQPIKRSTPHLTRGFLDPKVFKSLELTRIDNLSADAWCYTFKLPNAEDVIGLPIGQHVTVKATIDGKSVTRSYTPISNNLDKGILQLIVKIYPDGLLTGKYFSTLKVGDRVLFRGPTGAYKHTSSRLNKLGMVAGGTGVTPMYQLIRAICEDEYDTTEISLILANRTEKDILLRRELESFARRYPKNFKLWYMLDQPPDSWEYGSGFVTADVMKSKLPSPGGGHKIMLCGPPGIIDASKKALESLGFKTPGAIAKLSDEVFCF